MNKIKLAKYLVKMAKQLIINKQIKNIIYVAGIVKNDSDLKKLVQPGYDNIFCHHMTIKYGGMEELPDFIGKQINFTADKIYKDDNGIAITGIIDDSVIQNFMKQSNQHAHITICTASGVKPVYSNTLISRSKGQNINLNVKLKVEAFCVFENGSKGWIS